MVNPSGSSSHDVVGFLNKVVHSFHYSARGKKVVTFPILGECEKGWAGANSSAPRPILWRESKYGLREVLERERPLLNLPWVVSSWRTTTPPSHTDFVQIPRNGSSHLPLLYQDKETSP